MLLSVLYKQMIIKSAIPHRHHRARDMFALCSDSRKGSWRHAETLLATAGVHRHNAGPTTEHQVGADNFLFFSSKGKQPSWQKNKVKLPLI